LVDHKHIFQELDVIPDGANIEGDSFAYIFKNQNLRGLGSQLP
jgi:hypothetical protein